MSNEWQDLAFTKGDPIENLGKFTPEQSLYVSQTAWKLNQLVIESNRHSDEYDARQKHQAPNIAAATLADGIAANANHIYVLQEKISFLQTLVEDLYTRLQHMTVYLENKVGSQEET